MSNAIRKHSRGLLLPPNRKQRKFLHKLRELTKKVNKAVDSLTDKSNTLSQMATNESVNKAVLVEKWCN